MYKIGQTYSISKQIKKDDIKIEITSPLKLLQKEVVCSTERLRASMAQRK